MSQSKQGGESCGCRQVARILRSSGGVATIRLFGILIATFALLAGAPAASAEALSSPIQPNQHFIGLVNGKHADAVIYTICPGPASGDGRPAAGQSVAVRRTAAGGGDTGAGGSVIYARVTPTTILAMTRYGRPEPIPRSARVPCQGAGTIAFSSCPLPQPCGRGATIDNVRVTYIDLAA
jgi:hypothetical protein